MPIIQRSASAAALSPRRHRDRRTSATDLPWIESPEALPPFPEVVIRHVAARLMCVEFVTIATACYLATIVYHLTVVHAWPVAENYIPASILIASLVSIVAAAGRQFVQLHTRPRLKFLWDGLGAVALAFSLFLSAMVLAKLAELYSRGAFITQLVVVSIAVLAMRAIMFAWLRRAMASGALQARRVILIGERTDCARFTDQLRDPASRIVTVLPFPLSPGSTRRDGDDAGADDESTRTRSTIEVCREHDADDIIILSTKRSLLGSAALAYELSELPVGVHIVDMDTIDILAAARLVPFGNILTMRVYHRPLSPVDRFLKRSIDIVGAATALILFMPLLLMVSVWIKLDSRGPVFFRQARHGYNNAVIRVFKFRTMTTMEDGDKFTQAVANDPRVTRVGRMLRRTNIDELPQLFNVLSGEMSLVGPRPHATAHNMSFAGQLSRFSCRHRVKPGITGWAQVNGYRGPTDTVDKMRNRLEHDLYYIENWSLLLDIEILIMTLFTRTAYTNAY
ncbi:MAG: undecaprenyl-phosphate glucose phosphotransferase [Xanthobacteraceae bacterium]